MNFMTADTPFETRITRFEEIIEESNRIVFFGGAGVSTGSGIPDFRSPGGLYNNPPKEFKNVSPEYILSSACMQFEPELFFKFIRKYMDLRSYEPSSIHKYLTKLEEQNKLFGIVTQNIDNLHEKAGNKKVYKIHGTLDRVYCNKCRKQYDSDFIYKNTDPVPKCKCGGIIRPDVVLYDEKVQAIPYTNAYDAISHADCLIIAGTSMKVYPAAGLPNEFKGKYMIICNIEELPLDNYADIVFREDMVTIFDRLLADYSIKN